MKHPSRRGARALFSDPLLRVIPAGLALIIMGVFYARPLRQSSLETIPQYLVRNYGRAGGVFTSVVS